MSISGRNFDKQTEQTESLGLECCNHLKTTSILDITLFRDNLDKFLEAQLMPHLAFTGS